MSTPRYPSDLTDAQWALIEPCFGPPSATERPWTHETREIVNCHRALNERRGRKFICGEIPGVSTCPIHRYGRPSMTLPTQSAT